MMPQRTAAFAVHVGPGWDGRRTIQGRRHSCCNRRAGAPIRCTAVSSVSQDAVRDWAVANGAMVHERVALSTSSDILEGDLSVAEGDQVLLKGTELVVLPMDIVLSPKKERESLKALVGNDADISALSDESILAIALLRERSQGDESTLAAFVRTLPNEVYQAFLWTDEQLQYLEGSTVQRKAREVRAGIEEEWRGLHKGVFARNANHFPTDQFTLDLYLWAQAIVQARAISAGSALPSALAPLASAAGLAPSGDAACRMQVVGGGFFGRSRLALIASRDLSSGAHLTVARGDAAYTDELLLDFGAGGGNARVELQLQVTQMDRFFEDKEDVLTTQELGIVETFSLLAGATAGRWEPPANLEPFARLMCMGGTDAFLLEPVFRREVWDFVSLPVSKSNERAVCDYLVGACEDALDAYGTGGESDDVRWTLAMAVVDGEKKVLEACRDHYKRYIISLDELQYYQERRLEALDLLRPLDESEIVDADGGARMGRAFDQNY